MKLHSVLLSAGLAACEPASHQAPALQSVEIQCPYPIGTGRRDIWCVDAGGSPTGARTIEARHFDGNSWTLILNMPVDVGQVSAAPADAGAVWIVGAPAAAAAGPTVWRLDARGTIEDHSGRFPTMQPGGFGKVVARSSSVFVNFYDGNAYASFRLATSGFVQTTTFDAYPIELFSDNDIWGVSTGGLEHFDGATAMPTPGSGLASFGGPLDVWSTNFVGSNGTSGLTATHYDGMSWKMSEVPSDPDRSATIQNVQAVGAGRLGIFMLRSDAAANTTDFFGRAWDGSRLSNERLFYRLDCTDCVAGVQMFPPLQDGSIPVVASLPALEHGPAPTFLLSPRAFD